MINGLEKKSDEKVDNFVAEASYIKTNARIEFNTSKTPKIMFYAKNINFKNVDISVVKISKDSDRKTNVRFRFWKGVDKHAKVPISKKIFLVYREYENRKVPKIILLTIFLLFSYIMPHFYLLLFALRKSICFLRKVTIRQRQNQFFKTNYNILEK